MKCVWFMILCAAGVAYCIEHDFKGFDDSILFSLNWPGTRKSVEGLIEDEIKKSTNKETLEVRTTNKEDYECQLPELKESESISIEDYEGPSPINLLKPLFAQKICSYRLESYWSYEVCHGRYTRQYHDERDGKLLRTQEYFLGHWGIERQMKLEVESNAAQESKQKPQTTKVDGQALPYVEMVMDDGTHCDLNDKPRVTRVQYVCYNHGKHEIYSFKETSTCEYEIIILSPLLCEHPHFKPKEVSENIIDCLPMGDAPKKPRSLLKMEVDSLRFHHQTVRLMSNDKEKDVLAVFKIEKIDKDGETHLKFELQPLTEGFDLLEDKTVRPDQLPTTPAFSDNSPVRAFLNGENCLNGGTGWWKYEFCYGRHVSQFHVERGGEKTSLQLGTWDQDAHLQWISENKNKAPKPKEVRTSISHFYSNGDICDKTGKPRQTEVKLKCLENASSSSQVSLYLLEPRTCHYILGVESPLICEILPLADDNGLVKTVRPILERQDAVVETETSTEDDVDKPRLVEKLGND